MELTLRILGCGASGGVPAIGNFWGNCDPTEPKNNRTRASVVVQSKDACLVVDTGPDFRQQLNREDIQDIDAVLYTHAHGDHVAGIDELRSFQRRFKKQIPVYGDQKTLDEIQQRFGYMFKDFESLYQAVMLPNIFAEKNFSKQYEVAGIPFIPYKQDHYTCTSLGFRFGDISYSTDMVELDSAARDVVRGSRIWIVDGAGYYFEGSPVHASIPKIMEMNEDIGAEQVYLTHLSLLMDYQELCDKLPKGYYPCYDGLSFTTIV
jgi:phosphoribosyl 1,2-cyclic phosphate phosphodiesterase